MGRTASPPREWVPSCFLLLHDRHASSSLRFSPMHMSRAPDVSYQSTIKIYDRNPIRPIWTGESGAMHLEDVYTVESSRIVQESGATATLLYGEAFNLCREMAPPTANTTLPLHVRYDSDDGSFRGQLASFFIFGAPRSIQRGDEYYECFPGARIDADFSLRVFVINPFLRASRWSVQIVDSARATWTSPALTVRAKGAAEWSSRDSGFPGSPNPVGIVVRSELKTTSFFATRNAKGEMIGLDHGHPFIAQVLQ